MPYIRPIQLLRLQKTAAKAIKTNMVVEKVDGSDVLDDIKVCCVCGESDCGEDVVMIQDYLFHQSDVDAAEVVEVPEL